MPAVPLWQEVIGYFAAALTTFSFLPQVIKTVKTRDTKSLSLGTYSIFAFGVFMWLVYAILIGSGPIMIANGITLALVLIILFIKISNQRQGID